MFISISVLAGWMNGWMNGWINKWMNEWMNEYMYEWMDGWMDGWINDWINEWFNEGLTTPMVLDQEGGGVSRQKLGSVITTSVTSRLGSMMFGMAPKNLRCRVELKCWIYLYISRLGKSFWWNLFSWKWDDAYSSIQFITRVLTDNGYKNEPTRTLTFPCNFGIKELTPVTLYYCTFISARNLPLLRTLIK
jgi:hypothetical protein